MKKEGYVIVGYARKSPGKQKSILKIQNMTILLKRGSFVDKCFISLSSQALNDINTKDSKDDKDILNDVKDVQGNTQCIYFHYV